MHLPVWAALLYSPIGWNVAMWCIYWWAVPAKYLAIPFWIS
jgi:hypothetical protein